MKPIFQEEWELGEGRVRIMLLTPVHFLEGTARISHYVENPVFQGETFSLSEVQEYWMEQRGLTYEALFLGSNFGASDVSRFAAAFQEVDREECESWFIDECEKRDNLYFSILKLPANAAEDSLFQCELTLKHELAHALYCQKPPFRQLIHHLWNSLPSIRREQIHDRYAHFYASHRVIDEWAAHILASYEWEQVNDLSDNLFLELKSVYWSSVDRKRLLKTVTALHSSILSHCKLPNSNVLLEGSDFSEAS